MAKKFVGNADPSPLELSEPEGWQNPDRIVEIPDDLIARYDKALAEFIAVQNELAKFDPNRQP
jgi:hypothetical protein